MHKVMEFSLDPNQYVALKKVIQLEMQIEERERACAIVLKHIVPPENDGYWFNDVLREMVMQIKGDNLEDKKSET